MANVEVVLLQTLDRLVDNGEPIQLSTEEHEQLCKQPAIPHHYSLVVLDKFVKQPHRHTFIIPLLRHVPVYRDCICRIAQLRQTAGIDLSLLQEYLARLRTETYAFYEHDTAFLYNLHQKELLEAIASNNRSGLHVRLAAKAVGCSSSSSSPPVTELLLCRWKKKKLMFFETFELTIFQVAQVVSQFDEKVRKFYNRIREDERVHREECLKIALQKYIRITH